ncbi:MAG: hypothetical protein K8963_08610, partial [Proteobacteria bacterium]|nr:hypothetical protein [Pseudomonadota bacterium]
LTIAAQPVPGTPNPVGPGGGGCILTGTPTTPTARATYAVTVTNVNGPSTLMLDIVVDPAAPVLTMPGAQVYATGALATLTMTSSGGGMLNAQDGTASAGCVVSPATLPRGLNLMRATSGTSCVISGTPDTIQAATSYTVTATNVTDSTAVTFTIAVVSGTPTIAMPAALTFVDQRPITSEDYTFANTNPHPKAGPVTSCVAANLPAGLTIAAQPVPGTPNPVGPGGGGCFLAGTPAATATRDTYTVTVTNVNGPSTLMLDITVDPAPPVLVAPDSLAQVYATGAFITLSLANTGGAMLYDDTATATTVAGCAVTSGSLPSGLSIAKATVGSGCVISGTPG